MLLVTNKFVKIWKRFFFFNCEFRFARNFDVHVKINVHNRLLLMELIINSKKIMYYCFNTFFFLHRVILALAQATISLQFKFPQTRFCYVQYNKIKIRSVLNSSIAGENEMGPRIALYIQYPLVSKIKIK